MKSRLTALSLIIFCCIFISPVLAGSKTYIYRQRANWVKIIKLSNKQLAGQTLNHPYTQVTGNQMTAMLQSLQMNKGQIFKKGLKTSYIFNPVEARKYGPLIVKAIAEAGPNEVVNVAIVHNRALFVIRNDFITVMNVFANGEGVHFYFGKLFAKLGGDYQQAARVDESIRKAKSIRVSLQASEGQILAPDGDELILDPNFDFVNKVALSRPAAADEMPIDDETAKPDKNADVPKNHIQAPETTGTPAHSSITARLKTLDDLKKSNLISESEYSKKRAEILQEL